LDEFDTSDYPDDHPCKDERNRKRVGMFKDEANAVKIREFVGLRAKLYSIEMYGEDGKNKATAKGIDRNYVRQHFTHERYMDSWANMTRANASYYSIRSENHRIKTKKIVKEGLNALDTKRYICDDNTHTLAFGHYSIRK